MKSIITINNGKIYFKDIQHDNNISYEFIDKIGVFSQRFPIKFDNIGDQLELDLKKNFKKKIIDNLKICIYVESITEVNVELDYINELYKLQIYTENQNLYINVVSKDNLMSTSIKNRNLKIVSNYKTNNYLARMIDGTNFTTSMHLINRSNIIEVNELISIIESFPIKNQQWKLVTFIKDVYGNESKEFIEILNFIEINQGFIENREVFYNKKGKYLLYNNVRNVVDDYLKKINISEKTCEMAFNKGVKNQYLYFAVRARQGNLFNYSNYISFKINQGTVNIDLKRLQKNYLKDGDNIDILMGESFEDSLFLSVSYDVAMDEKYFNIEGSTQGKFYLNGRGALSIYISKQSNTISKSVPKVAVLGTCFSRNALNTNSFFNKDYKNYVNCVFTQFHSKLDSLNSSPAPKSLVNQYSKHKEFNHIYRDMSKSFFDELRKSKAEILIIDLYADAMLKSLTLNNGSKITYNYLMKDNNELGNYVKNWTEDQFLSEENLLKEWTENLHQFMRQVTEIIPEANIILNRGRLAEKYYENDNELKTFSTINLIKRNNYFWEKLDNIVITNYPKVRVIDLTDQPYYASKNHPFGFSFSHYESKYYKEFFSELIKQLFLIKQY